ncbi:MAG: DNA polymerase I [Clostridiales bacterium]|nr:DNA polymerase I [Clostridiales bacterium]
MEDKRIVIIDGNSLMNRAYYALPPLMNKEGLYTNAIYGFTNMLNKIITEYNPYYIAVAFDKKAPTFRHQEYTEYKAGRKKMPLELAQQLPLLKEVLEARNITMMELEGFEADDLIGTVVKKSEEEGIRAIVITGDKDALQLASDVTQIVITKKGISEFEAYDRQYFEEKYGIKPEQFVDLKGLMGDSSDNIPGVPGIGEKTGLELIKAFGSIDNMLNRLDEIKSEKTREKIKENVQLAILSRRLAEIHTQVPLEVNFSDYILNEPNIDRLVELYNRLEFYSLIPKLKKSVDNSADNKRFDLDLSKITSYTIADENALNELEKYLSKDQEITLKIFSDQSHIHNPELFGMSILADDVYFYINLSNQAMKERVKAVFNKYDLNMIGHEVKTDIYNLLNMGISNFNIKFDTAVAQYLIQPERSNYLLSALSLEYLHAELMDEAEFIKNNSQIDLFKDIDKPYAEYGLKWCHIVKAITDILQERLEKESLAELYYKIELPLVEVLASMEYQGFNVDEQELIRTGNQLANEIDIVTEKIYDLAGESFNINSPKQLGPILYEKLQLPMGKKTKSGYSTSIDVLERLNDKHDIIPLIIEYRSLTKLKSTYIDGLIPLINKKTGKIHAHFNQTVTTTGRISCTEPNLQNIPIKQESGRLLRKAFIPDEDHVLMGADYSQIELRVLAHLSEDPSLIEAFMTNQDIHAATASRVFNIPLDEVTALQRSRAKAVNFGVIYGMSDYGLSENLRISRKEAGLYIDEYFKKYSMVKTYMDKIIQGCKEKGYVTTIMNRKRYIPEIHSKNFNIRSLGERLAMNTPIQGSAADIIKIAMRDVYNALKNEKTKSKLILQIHDELIIEVHKDEIETVKKLLVEKMENAVQLKVPLKVDFHIGENWYELK